MISKPSAFVLIDPFGTFFTRFGQSSFEFSDVDHLTKENILYFHDLIFLNDVIIKINFNDHDYKLV